ncbi:MAG: tyrosine-type recombinase/integrase [Lachnospirales bacterium]
MRKMSKNLMYGQYMDEWLEYHKQFIKASTYSLYKIIIENHIKIDLGMYKLKHINNDLIQEFVLQKLQNGRKDNKGGLKEKTVRDIVVVIKLSLRYAFDKGIMKNFNMKIIYPKEYDTKKLILFNTSEVNILNNYLISKPTEKNIGILLALYSGLRIGELCALKMSDINTNSKCINIDKTLQRVYIRNGFDNGNSEILITSPKTKNSLRVLPIPNFINELLIKLKISENKYLLTGTEKYTEPRTYRAYYERLLKKLEIDFKKFHCLRHTFASKCIEIGVDYKTVSEMMGHSNINTTLNLYVHSNFEQKEKAVNELFLNFN